GCGGEGRGGVEESGDCWGGHENDDVEVRGVRIEEGRGILEDGGGNFNCFTKCLPPCPCPLSTLSHPFPPCILRSSPSLAHLQLNVKSFANNNQLAIMPDERVQVLEWNRRYLTVLAVANRRLYQLRLQVPERLLDSERPVLRQVMDSFRVFSVAD
ncbi:unnamed protein product, partial [Closterium sp. NIES-65]